MHRPAHPSLIRQENGPGIYCRAGVLTPVLGVLAWMLAWAVRIGVVPCAFLDRPPAPDSAQGFHRNRSLRRARESCLRRARRAMIKTGRPINPADYMPRAYAHFAYVASMPKRLTPGQFMEHYARDSGFGRVRVLGLAALHHVTGFVGALRAMLSGFAGIFGLVAAPDLSAPAMRGRAPP